MSARVGVYFNFVIGIVSQNIDSPTNPVRFSYQAEVFLKEGGKNYNVMEWTQEDLLQDIIDQYERHLYFLNVVRN